MKERKNKEEKKAVRTHVLGTLPGAWGGWSRGAAGTGSLTLAKRSLGARSLISKPQEARLLIRRWEPIFERRRGVFYKMITLPTPRTSFRKTLDLLFFRKTLDRVVVSQYSIVVSGASFGAEGFLSFLRALAHNNGVKGPGTDKCKY
jgi:hypothetical protein